MTVEKMSPTYKKDNIRLLRRYLGLTQKEFISQFLSSEDGQKRKHEHCYAVESGIQGRRPFERGSPCGSGESVD